MNINIMAKKKTPKYPYMPLYIVQIGKAFNTHTGLYLSPQQLASYTIPKEVIENKQEHKQQEHWINKYYGNE